MVEALVMDGGRPLVLAPASTTIDLATPPKSALIAWTDTAEAARALSHALALLGPDTKVTLLGVGPVDLEGPAYLLAAHGFNAAQIPIERPEGGLLDDPTGDAILKVAEDQKADLIVMGAFVHSRLRQMIVGGPTRTLLRESRVPLLLAH
ncbi:MAG: universal stress protein [Alphaproteobacteria bacterium]